MQIRRNTVVVIAPKERVYDKPRLAIVKSIRKDGTVNCTFSLYKDSTAMTDYLCSVKDVIAVTDVSENDFRNLATCFPNKDPNDPFIQKQKALDAQYPVYAAMRKDYGPRETIFEGVERIRRERELTAA